MEAQGLSSFSPVWQAASPLKPSPEEGSRGAAPSTKHAPSGWFWKQRSLVRARADAEALEARAHAAEAAEASLAFELRAAEAAVAELDAAHAKCAALEERLSELRSEQDQEMHGGGTAATQGCPGPEKSGNMITGKANLGLTSGLWSEGMELVVDPCKAGNALRYINDYMGMPGGVTKNVATVEVFDHDTLRPHILFFTIEAVSAGEELLMDYGEAARKAAAEAQREVEVANAKTAEAMEEVVRARDVVQMAIQEAEDAYAEARLAKKEARKAKREKAELENLLKKHGIKH
ncbi:g2803 [Coccomyxa elongata]